MRTVFLLAGLALASSAALAQGLAKPAGEWRWRGALYGYLPSVGGTTLFPDPNQGSSVGVDAATILDKLEMAFMGSIEGHNGQWGAFADILYVSLGDSRTGWRGLSVGGAPLPAEVTATAKYDLKGTITSVGGAYRIVSDGRTTLDAVGGLRFLNLRQKLDWQLSGNLGNLQAGVREGARSNRLTHTDVFAGVKGRSVFGAEGRWFVPYELDVGTGESRVVWQALSGVGYRFAWGDVVGAWRHIDYRMDSGQVVQSLNFSGPMVAAVVSW